MNPLPPWRRPADAQAALCSADLARLDDDLSRSPRPCRARHRHAARNRGRTGDGDAISLGLRVAERSVRWRAVGDRAVATAAFDDGPRSSQASREGGMKAVL